MQDRIPQFRVEQIGDCTLYLGDCIDVLKTLPDASVDCCVTSPPYWGLRDYGYEEQIGMEPTLQEFIERLVEVFREVRRVLKKEGTCWVNMGDSYAATTKGSGVLASKQPSNAGSFYDARFNLSKCGLKPKDLVGQPWRLAFALQDDGWYLRSDIIWHKPNPMPESVTDRPTKAHEYVFLLTKSERYWYDADAIRECSITDDLRRPYGSPGANALDPRQKQGEGKLRKCGTNSRANVDRVPRLHLKQDAIAKQTYVGFNDRYEEPADGKRNARTVWTIATKPFKEAHFATFPPELARRCIFAGCPEGGTVLDPFGGAGTTAVVAGMYGRKSILAELSEEYFDIACRRIADAYKQPRLFDPEPVQKPVQVAMPLLVEASRD